MINKSDTYKNILLNEYFTIRESLFFRGEDGFIQKTNKITLSSSGTAKKILIIIGESETRNRMSIFGYARQTTPNFSSDKKVVPYYSNVTNGVNTQPNLTTLLTGLAGRETNQINQTLFSVSKAARYYTTVIDNNSFMDRNDPLYLIKSSADKYINLNGLGKATSSSDGAIGFDQHLLDLFNSTYKHNTNNEVYILHLMGNHPPQSSRFPASFSRFDSNYDNSVLYNDFIVSKAKNTFLEVNKDFPAVVIYISDHGVGLPHGKDTVNPVVDDILAYGANDNFISNYEPPLLFWVNNCFKIKYRDMYNSLIKNQYALIDQRFLFYSVSDLMGVSTVNNNTVSNFSVFNPKLKFPTLLYSDGSHTTELLNNIYSKIDTKNCSTELSSNCVLFNVVKNYFTALDSSNRVYDFSTVMISAFVNSYSGVSNVESWGRWSDATEGSMVTIKSYSLPKRIRLIITCKGFGPNTSKPTRVLVGGEEQSIMLTPALKSYSLDFNNKYQSNIINIIPPSPVSPKDLGQSNDDRKLGVGISKIIVKAM